MNKYKIILNAGLYISGLSAGLLFKTLDTPTEYIIWSFLIIGVIILAASTKEL